MVLGFVTGNSYKAVEKSVGRVAALVVLAVVLIAIAIWRIRAHRAESAREQDESQSAHATTDRGDAGNLIRLAGGSDLGSMARRRPA